jgi:PAS domain S-box-containing protein
MVSSKGKKSSAKQISEKKKSTSAVNSEVEKKSVISSPPKNSIEQALAQVEDYAILTLDTHGNITSWNKGAESIKGYSASEILGKNYRIFYTREDRENKLSDKLLEEARTRGKTNYEGWRVRKDGTRFWGSMTLTALSDENGKLTRFLKVTRDLTEKKIAEDRLGNLIEELKEKNEELKRSEQRYHKMISEVKDYAIISLDKDGKILDWNLGAEKLKGYKPSEIVGKSIKLFYPKEEKEAKLPERLMAEAVRHGSITHEGWRIKKNGQRFWGLVALTALHDDAGNVIGFSKVTRDLTDRKIAEDKVGNIIEELQQVNEKLKQSEERYHKMIDEVQEYAIVLLSVTGEVLNWNAGAALIKGYSPGEILGKNFRLFYSKEDRDAGLPEQLLETARQNGRVTHEGWRVRRDGSRFWGSVVITALHNGEGQIIGFSKVTRDLTERKRTEEALRDNAAQLDLKNKTLERLNSELSSFSYIASHDLKEPLRKILTFAAKIRTSGISAETSTYIDKIMQSGMRMQNLIHDLLAYSEITNDESSFQRVDLNDTLKAVKNDLEVVIQEKNAVIKSKKLPIVNGIPHQLSQMFFNLLSNSIKFSKAEVPPEISIDCRVIKGPDISETNPNDNRYYHLEIKDNGIGFEEEFSRKIFEAFQRLHAKSEFSGTGIGLAIVKKVVENHNGVIDATSAPGIGSTFNVYLPFNT